METKGTPHEKLVKDAIEEAAYESNRPDLIEAALEIYNKSQALIEHGQRGEKMKFRAAIDTVIESIK